MLYDVKLRTYDRVRKTEQLEIITVDTSTGDDAAEAGLALRPKAVVVGVAPRGGFGPVGGAVLEADESPPEDEDTEPGPSARERAVLERSSRRKAAS